MRRALGSLLIVFGLLLGPTAAAPVAASTPDGAVTWGEPDHLGPTAVAPVAARTQQGAVTWGEPNDTAKTITVKVQLQIYSICDSCPGAVNQFLADRMKKQILDVWNRNYHYRCYELIFEVDIKLATDRNHVDTDRVGIRIDNSPVPIRSFVQGVSSMGLWNSNDPKDRLVPDNDPDNPSTWAENFNDAWHYGYAHEFGHILGLSDHYEDKKDPVTGRLVSVPYSGAPVDLMANAYRDTLAQETIDRVVERSPVDRSKLKCGWKTNADTPLGEGRGTKCGGAGGEWTVKAVFVYGTATTHTTWKATINATTLAGTFTYKSIQTAGPTLTEGTSSGKAHIVVNPDGSVTLTLDEEPVKLVTTVKQIGSGTATIDGQRWDFLWLPRTERACP